MLDFHSADFRRNPYPAYDRIRALAPVVQDSRTGCWMVLDYAGVKQVLHDPETFSSRATPRPGDEPMQWLIFFDPPRHTKVRALVSMAFTPKSISALERRIREIAAELLDKAVPRREMDLVGELAVPLPMRVIAEMLGVPGSDWLLFKGWTDVILGLIYTVFGGEEGAQAGRNFAQVSEQMQSYLADQLAERRAAPRDDLLSRLVAAEVDGERLTEHEILRFFQLLLVAGSETTTNLVANTVVCLLDHPDQMARLQREPQMLPGAIEEVLRYRSPIQVMFRVAKRDVALHGQKIPAGSLVFAMIGAANRDPQQFTDPARFDIARDPNPHISFGHGIHFCLGAPLSRLEARVALGDLLGRVQTIEPAGAEPWEPRRAFLVHGPTSLPIRFTCAAQSAAS
jgi:cytochrome P450